MALLVQETVSLVPLVNYTAYLSSKVLNAATAQHFTQDLLVTIVLVTATTVTIKVVKGPVVKLVKKVVLYLLVLPFKPYQGINLQAYS